MLEEAGCLFPSVVLQINLDKTLREDISGYYRDVGYETGVVATFREQLWMDGV